LEEAAGPVGFRLEGRRPQHYPLTIPKPMIAAVNGACAGIGLVQALVCDVRFMARGARVSTAYAKLGIPAEYGLSWILPRLIGVERALDLLLSARPVGADEAERIGLVSRVCDPDTVVAEATAYAGMLATNCSPRSMATIRRQVWGDLSRGYTEANEVWLAAMRRLNRPENPDFAEGVDAFVHQRTAQFGSLPADFELPTLPPFAKQ
jgi:enoyl-CoA hydratase/carnithine racemase